MRVITGTKRGIRLETLEGEAVRPTLEKTKEAVFSAIHFDIEGRRVLDLFAGSGQLGIEALSRGAERAVFIDSSAEALEVVKRNVKKTGLEKQSVICRADAVSFVKATKETFDIAFLDPPYREGILIPAIKAILPLMSEFSTIVCEHPTDVELPEEIGGFTTVRSYRYGKIAVTVYKSNKAVAE